MLIEVCNIEWLSPGELDDALARGWFRGRGVMFKAELFVDKSKLDSPLNIRIHLPSYSPKKKHRKLLRRNRAKYRIQWGKPAMDDEHDAVFRLHAKRLKRNKESSLEDAFLLGGPKRQFTELECAVYHNDKLVAFSYLDVGVNSCASIMCAFDPAFEADSLGIYTMLEEIDKAKQDGLDWYYPGWIFEIDNTFDYKLSLAPVEWLVLDDVWHREEFPEGIATARQVITDKMQMLHEILALHGIDAQLIYNPFFTSGYARPDEQFLPLPVFFVWRHGQRHLGAGFHCDTGLYLFFEPKLDMSWEEYVNSLGDWDSDEVSDRERFTIRMDFQIYFSSFTTLYAILEEILNDPEKYYLIQESDMDG